MTTTSLISSRARFGTQVFPPQVQHIDLVQKATGELVDVQTMNALQKFMFRNSDMITIATDQQRLVFRSTLNVGGRQVDAKLTMLIAPDRNVPRAFVDSFYRSGTNQVTSGLLIKSLRHHVESAISENLSYVNVLRVPLFSPVKSSARHFKLADICQGKGLHLYTDELTIEAIR